MDRRVQAAFLGSRGAYHAADGAHHRPSWLPSWLGLADCSHCEAGAGRGPTSAGTGVEGRASGAGGGVGPRWGTGSAPLLGAAEERFAFKHSQFKDPFTPLYRILVYIQELKGQHQQGMKLEC